MLSESRDYLTGPPVDAYPVGATYEMTVSQLEGQPSDTWFPVTLGADGFPLLLVGPGSAPAGPGRLTSGRWWRFLRVTTPGGVILPVVQGEGFAIVGGLASPPVPPSTIGLAELTAAVAALQAATAAGDVAGAAALAAQVAALTTLARGLARPWWLPADAAASTLDILGTTVANTLMTAGSAYFTGCQWFGPDNTTPTAARFIVGVAGGGVTLFRKAIYDRNGVRRYATANSPADANNTGTRTMPYIADDATPYRFAFGEPFSEAWLSVGGTSPQIPRFAALSAALINMGAAAPMRRAVVIAGITDLPRDLSAAVSSPTVWLGQTLFA